MAKKLLSEAVEKIGGTFRKKCGDGGYRCKNCLACRKENDERWESIWKEKYQPQMKDYYNPSSVNPGSSLGMRSTLGTINFPVVEESELDLRTEESKEKQRERMRKWRKRMAEASGRDSMS